MKFLYSIFFLMPVLCLGKGKTDTLNEMDLFHFQLTYIGQYHPAFHAGRMGYNTQDASKITAYSLTSTFYLAKRLIKNTSFYLNPEIAGGQGVGKTVGIAGFPNGETYRVGNPSPTFYIARLYIQQTINLGEAKDTIAEDLNQLKEVVSTKRLSFFLGKFCLADFFDGNTYSHDPRTQFMNWSLMSAGAWDFAANTRGYTWGLNMVYTAPGMRLRAGVVMEPETANGPFMDLHFNKAHAFSLEWDKEYKLAKKKGVIRLIGFYNRANMGNYQQAIIDAAGIATPDITATRSYSHNKYGFVFNTELAMNDNQGIFARLSWNDGHSETWAFTEIDRSASIGYTIKGAAWHRSNDEIGVAGVLNGLSKDHKDYLAAGGYGFIIGDGGLNYSLEMIPEIYYKFSWNKYCSLSADYQLAINPGYNKDNGPIHLLALRAHIAF